MINPQFDYNNNLYNIIEFQRMQNYPLHYFLQYLYKEIDSGNNPAFNIFPGSVIKAHVTLGERLLRIYKKPSFDIESCTVNNTIYSVEFQQTIQLPFCNLMHFKKLDCKIELPKMLIFAPMAGHHATLLRSTVEGLLPFFDIYITDWIDASQVPLSAGKFDLDDYIDYSIKFISSFKTPVHTLAVCQPTVPVLAAAAIMSDQKIGTLPHSLILMGGPVDARKNPTYPNDFATSNNIEWFENTVITTVPSNYPGSGRKVYPGFLQLLGFISLNPQRHIDSYVELFNNIINNKQEAENKHINFYDEYLSVMDLPAEFYLDTIKEVFQDFSLAKGELAFKNHTVDLKKITNIALMGIEGENDDIAAVGQTRAALDLCSNLPKSSKEYYLQKGVGHYGVFSGSKFRNEIVPVIRDFAYKVSKNSMDGSRATKQKRNK